MIGFHYHLPLRSLFGKPFSDLLSKNSVPNTIISHLRKYGNSGQLISGRAISCLPRFYYLLTNIIIEQFLFSHHRSSRQSTSDSTKNFVQLQRKIARKRRPLASEYEKHEVGSKVVAIAVADSFDITGVLDDHGLVDNFHYACIDDDPEFGLHFAPKSSENSDLNGETIREFFLYSDGVVVFWDIAQSERNHILNYLTKHTNEPYDSQLVVDETDTMPFVVTNNALTQIKNDQFLINIRSNESGFTSSKSILERYAFSHGLAASVKIGVWESQLSSRAETLALTTKALSEGYIRMRRKEVLQMIGHFSDLRHMINLNCGLLDADFYWDHEQLERLYDQTTHHFMVPRRIRLLNNRLDYCENLVQLVDGMLAHRHASTLEWMIIILIVVEVIFDILHFLESSTKRQMLEKPIETK